MINEKRIIDTFLEYVQVDSETFDEGKMSELLFETLKELGLDVRMETSGQSFGSTGNNVVGFLKGKKDIEPRLFSAHMDTVKPGIGVKPIIEETLIKTDGTTVLGGDDKSGIVAIVEALRVIKENDLDHGPIEVVLTVNEEGGMGGSKNLEYDKIQSEKGYVFDSGGLPGKMIVAAPAARKFIVKIIGKPAHAGVAPETGINAIIAGSEAISNMKLLRIDEETTANVGFFNGGVATNIVCPEVDMILECRSLSYDKLDAQTDHMKKCLEDACEKYGATLELEIRDGYGAINYSLDDPYVLETKALVEKAGLVAETMKSGGGSDANVMAVHGLKIINLATGMSKVHTTEEFILKESLYQVSNLALTLMLRD